MTSLALLLLNLWLLAFPPDIAVVVRFKNWRPFTRDVTCVSLIYSSNFIFLLCGAKWDVRTFFSAAVCLQSKKIGDELTIFKSDPFKILIKKFFSKNFMSAMIWILIFFFQERFENNFFQIFFTNESSYHRTHIRTRCTTLWSNDLWFNWKLIENFHLVAREI